ncbi:hypothetical protein DDV21_010260 [Streptococcus chenjunshii]|uniref:Lipoprotein n=1 Tax=Streptococcus chenjunshii TaxID=2173853 RepID=A0A372KLP6_9STRE|nr:hypothetical protein [Streptococcus chenjunshii]AXQ79432.1 hypothetical protein DDV21_010260 [Streptococcus chenjunshii]RFU51111.1 hypothetical protein DDV22_05240 [Streptococcus chenjunshii]RFU53209.1 hypothetical protein DDV23_05750 [Streptococcus chenjunshii]
MKKFCWILCLLGFTVFLAGCSDIGKKQELEPHFYVKVLAVEYDSGEVRVDVEMDSSEIAKSPLLYGPEMTLKNADGDDIKFKRIELDKGTVDGVHGDEEVCESDFVGTYSKGVFTAVFGEDDVISKSYTFSLDYDDKTFTWKS